ncbi:MAG: hypothetical protein JJ916_13130 [Phycisphaerales bacterium]|nr:hypothetical protein [Phycisphaerales bacterium]
MDDLLDPSLTPVQICKAHGLRLDQLADIMQTDAYRKSAAAIAQITTNRTTLITNHEALRARSLQQDIARDAYLAATDLDQAAASRDPKLASTRARLHPRPPPRNRPQSQRPQPKATPSGLPRESKIRLWRTRGGGFGAAEDGGGLFQLPHTHQVPTINQDPLRLAPLDTSPGSPGEETRARAQTNIPEGDSATFGPPRDSSHCLLPTAYCLKNKQAPLPRGPHNHNHHPDLRTTPTQRRSP